MWHWCLKCTVKWLLLQYIWHLGRRECWYWTLSFKEIDFIETGCRNLSPACRVKFGCKLWKQCISKQKPELIYETTAGLKLNNVWTYFCASPQKCTLEHSQLMLWFRCNTKKLHFTMVWCCPISSENLCVILLWKGKDFVPVKFKRNKWPVVCAGDISC